MADKMKKQNADNKTSEVAVNNYCLKAGGSVGAINCGKCEYYNGIKQYGGGVVVVCSR